MKFLKCRRPGLFECKLAELWCRHAGIGGVGGDIVLEGAGKRDEAGTTAEIKFLNEHVERSRPLVDTVLGGAGEDVPLVAQEIEGESALAVLEAGFQLFTVC